MDRHAHFPVPLAILLELLGALALFLFSFGVAEQWGLETRGVLFAALALSSACVPFLGSGFAFPIARNVAWISSHRGAFVIAAACFLVPALSVIHLAVQYVPVMREHVFAVDCLALSSTISHILGVLGLRLAPVRWYLLVRTSYSVFPIGVLLLLRWGDAPLGFSPISLMVLANGWIILCWIFVLSRVLPGGDPGDKKGGEWRAAGVWPYLLGDVVFAGASAAMGVLAAAVYSPDELGRLALCITVGNAAVVPAAAFQKQYGRAALARGETRTIPAPFFMALGAACILLLFTQGLWSVSLSVLGQRLDIWTLLVCACYACCLSAFLIQLEPIRVLAPRKAAWLALALVAGSVVAILAAGDRVSIAKFYLYGAMACWFVSAQASVVAQRVRAGVDGLTSKPVT